MKEITEKTALVLTVVPINTADVAQAPTAFRYRVDDLASGDEIRDWTTVSPSASMTITLDATDNAIQYDRNGKETRVVTMEATHAGGLLTDDYIFRVRNLRFYPAA